MKNFIRELFFDNIEPQTNIYKENKKLSKNMDIVVERENRRRELRQVRPLPYRHQAHLPAAGEDHRWQSGAGGSRSP